MKRTVLALGSAIVLLTLSSCSSPTTPTDLARSLCQSAFGSKALNSAPGTVTDVRTTAVGPEVRMAPHAFPEARVNEVIGWCWTGEPGNYELYAVAAGYKPVRVEGLAGKLDTVTPPPGPAAIP